MFPVLDSLVVFVISILRSRINVEALGLTHH
jgi:hypothetical protein